MHVGLSFVRVDVCMHGCMQDCFYFSCVYVILVGRRVEVDRVGPWPFHPACSVFAVRPVFSVIFLTGVYAFRSLCV